MDTSGFVEKLEKGVQTKFFDLNQVEQKSVQTGRTIKKSKGWSGYWPPIREFLQNTLDHLNIMDYSTGRRNAAVTMEIAEEPKDKRVTFRFLCGNTMLCSITVLNEDELLIQQAFTFPIPTRALDTGVPDTTKQQGNTAGGFGDGLKTAAVSLISNGSEFKQLEWIFEVKSETITWDFIGRPRKAVAAFADCLVLEVDIKRIPKTASSSSKYLEIFGIHDICQDNLMKQYISCNGIGKAFLIEAVPRLQAFWDLSNTRLIDDIMELKPTKPDDLEDDMKAKEEYQIELARAKKYKVKEPREPSSKCTCGEFMARAASLPPIATLDRSILPTMVFDESSESTSAESAASSSITASPLSLSKKGMKLSESNKFTLVPLEGIYIRGIYVCNPRIPKTISSFYSPRLDVTGRDRNDVDERQLVRAVAFLMVRAIFHNREKLIHLLTPLLGTTPKSSSWLLKYIDEGLIDRVLKRNRDNFLFDIFKFSKTTMFVSTYTTRSKDPLIAWSAYYLRKSGAPVAPIGNGASAILFTEVSGGELLSRCVELLVREDNERPVDPNIMETKQYLTRCLEFISHVDDDEEEKKKKKNDEENDEIKRSISEGISEIEKCEIIVIFTPALKFYTFAHQNYLFLPLSPLTRDLLNMALNACLARNATMRKENFLPLTQAIFERCPDEVALKCRHIDRTLKRAHEIKNKFKNIMKEAYGGSDGEDGGEKAKDDKVEDDQGSSKPPLPPPPPWVTTVAAAAAAERIESSNIMPPTPPKDSEMSDRNFQNIVSEKVKSSQNNANNSDTDIASKPFAKEDNGTENCLIDASDLTCVEMSDDFGGGKLLLDPKTVKLLKDPRSTQALKEWPKDHRRIMAALQCILNDTINLVKVAIPSLEPLLNKVRPGFDSVNLTYRGFCSGDRYIVINLACFLTRFPINCLLKPSSPSRSPPPPSSSSSSSSLNTSKLITAAGKFTPPPILKHEFLATLTHELAHMLDDAEGSHAMNWRNLHMKLLNMVYSSLLSDDTQGGAADGNNPGAIPGMLWASKFRGAGCIKCQSR